MRFAFLQKRPTATPKGMAVVVEAVVTVVCVGLNETVTQPTKLVNFKVSNVMRSQKLKNRLFFAS